MRVLGIIGSESSWPCLLYPWPKIMNSRHNILNLNMLFHLSSNWLQMRTWNEMRNGSWNDNSNPGPRGGEYALRWHRGGGDKQVLLCQDAVSCTYPCWTSTTPWAYHGQHLFSDVISVVIFSPQPGLQLRLAAVNIAHTLGCCGSAFPNHRCVSGAYVAA